MESNTTGKADGLSIHQLNAQLKRQWEEKSRELTALRAEGSNGAALRCERQLRRIEEDVIRANRGLAVGRARRFTAARSGIDGDDYVAVAQTALWEAFRDWDPAKGTLSTFCVPYMDGAVRRAVATIEAPEISYGDWSAGPKVRSAAASLERSLGRQPGFDEIAAACGESITLVERVLMSRPASLDAPVGDGDTTRGDLASKSDGDLHDVAFGGSAYEDDDAVIATLAKALDDRELFVMLRKHGLDGGRTHSLNEIGQLLGTSREAIRRTEDKAKTKLRSALG